MIEMHRTPIRFLARVNSRNPEVIMKRKMATVYDYAFDTTPLRGEFYRVTPTSAREVLFLASLLKYHDKWAPAKGDGIIVRADIIDQFKRTVL